MMVAQLDIDFVSMDGSTNNKNVCITKNPRFINDYHWHITTSDAGEALSKFVIEYTNLRGPTIPDHIARLIKPDVQLDAVALYEAHDEPEFFWKEIPV